MDILDVIKKEHAQVAGMLEEAQRCEPGAARIVELASEISKALAEHVTIEERLFYSRLRDRAEDDEELIDVYEAYTEHDVVDHLLALLKSKRKPDEKFKAELQVLGENVKHHVKEEESKVFAIARQVIEPEEREKLGAKWLAEKEALKRKPAARGGSPRKKARKAPATRKASATRKAAATRKTAATRKR